MYFLKTLNVHLDQVQALKFVSLPSHKKPEIMAYETPRLNICMVSEEKKNQHNIIKKNKKYMGKLRSFSHSNLNGISNNDRAQGFLALVVVARANETIIYYAGRESVQEILGPQPNHCSCIIKPTKSHGPRIRPKCRATWI